MANSLSGKPSSTAVALGANVSPMPMPAIAKVAGVSQPYVVRIFGPKLELYLEVFRLACGRIGETFQRVVDAEPFDPDDEAAWGLPVFG